ncbi:hypothetical protein AX16_001842 [Volvariella volvacea WC 439]|nr:hypothetical protein AX16_001842 [Volvariella volvacea WC 439]
MTMSSKSANAHNRIVTHVIDPPRTWYGADFNKDNLPYSRATTHALSLTHPPTTPNPTPESNFWKRYINIYIPRPLDTLIPHTPPINNFPTELLCKILCDAAFTPSSYIDPQDVIGRTGDERLDLNPLLLGQVCTRWRNIVRSMPQLWSTIRVSNPGYSQVCLAELYLVRSGTAVPLTLSLQQLEASTLPDFDRLYSCNASAEAILSLFVEQIHRWRGINFRIFSEVADVLLTCGKLTPGAANILEVAHVQLVGWEDELQSELEGWREEWETCVWECIGSSSTLKDISWATMRPDPLTPTTIWSKITNLELVCDYAEPFYEILSHLQELEVLRFVFPYEDLPTSPPSPTVLPKLHTLELETRDIFNVLQSITAPSLKKIHVILKEMEIADAVQFDEFLSRSQCEITHFSLTNNPRVRVGMQEDVILKYLGIDALKRVQVIRIRACVCNATISYFMEGRFPSLTKLLLSHCDTTDGVVGDMALKLLEGEAQTDILPIGSMSVGFMGEGNKKDSGNIGP